MKHKACLIFNPVAGQGCPEQDLESILSILNGSANESSLSSELDLDVVTTTAEDDLGQLAKDAIASGAELIIASGGDGTLSAVAAALMGTNIPLGVISRGTANAFANALNLPTSIPDACAAIVAGHTQVVDMACCHGLPMVLLAGIGFEAETVDLADRDDVGFWRSQRFKVTTTPPQKVVVDGEVIGTTPIEIECIPGGLTVFAPQVEEVQPLEKLEGLPNLKIDLKV